MEQQPAFLDLSAIFKAQEELNAHISENHPEAEKVGVENFYAALLVEVAECMNEWRGFKVWSNDREPRREKMLEEFADCLSFAVVICLELNRNVDVISVPKNNDNVFYQFMYVTWDVANDCEIHKSPRSILIRLIQLGYSLGFSWSEIESAYFKKNAVNHKRQESGY